MVTTTNLLSWQAFEQLPADGMRHEVIEGELICLPPPKSRHSLIASNVAEALRAFKQRGLGRVLAEAGYKLSDNPPTWIQPDISLLSTERIQNTAPDGYFIGAPDLAVEIVSPSESARDLDRKVEALLRARAIAVWVVFPDSRRIRIFRGDGTSFSGGMNDTLSLRELLPDWELPVSKLFEE